MANLVEDAKATIGDVVTSVHRVRDVMNKICSGSQAHSIGIGQVDVATSLIEQVTR